MYAPIMKMRHVDDIQHTEDQRVADGDDCIGAAQSQTVDKLLRKHVHVPFCKTRAPVTAAASSVPLEGAPGKAGTDTEEKAPAAVSADDCDRGASARYHPIFYSPETWRVVPVIKKSPTCMRR